MKFRDLVNSIQSRWKESSTARRTERGLRHYRNSGQVLYPRLFGYHRTDVGIEVVESEARIVRLILRMLAAGKSPKEIKRALDEMDLRSRSGNRFTEREIRAMPKPVYVGVIETRSGRWVKSAFYEPIVSVEILKSAQKAIQRLLEGQDFGLSALDGRVFLTTAG